MSDVYQVIKEIGIVPALNIKKTEYAAKLGEALKKGGVYIVEVLMRNEQALDTIREMRRVHPDMTVGAGTVLNAKQAESAVAAGAEFIVSPSYNQELVDWCIEKKIQVLPGCASAFEIQAAVNSGLSLVKFFPSESLGGLKVIEEYAKVYRGVKFLPTSGITVQNARTYLASKIIAAVGGSFIAPADYVDSGNWDGITEKCRQAIDASLDFRLAHVGINAENEDEAFQTASAIADLFRIPVIDKSRSVFSGEAVEVMKHGGRGTKGHIGFKTSSVDRAVAYFKRRGINMIPETAGYAEDGSLKYVYLDIEIAGFAIHLC